MDKASIVGQIQIPGVSEGLQAPKAAPGFQEALKGAISEVNRLQGDSDRAMQELHAGGSKNLHEVMVAMEKADISMRLMVSMRNKVVDAYQEIMRMQV